MAKPATLKIIELEGSIREVLAQALTEAAGPEFARDLTLETPKNDDFGDLSLTTALKAARVLKKPPRQIAEKLRDVFMKGLKTAPWGSRVAKVTVDGPGYLNITLSRKGLTDILREIHALKEAFGQSPPQKGKILLEFVSANPTGPLTVAHGRQAALGDALARILRHAGHAVSTEYYNNDEGVQIRTLGQSLEARVREKKGETPAFPENGYKGEYLKELAERYPASGGTDYADFAKDAILEGIRKDLKDFDVTFDNWYSQKILGASGRVEKTLEALKKKGVVFEKDGAVWLRSTKFGDDKDRVLVKSDRTYTYLMPDIAYHHDKFGRGFARLIDILGPDHHGYIARLKASQAALGHDPESVQVRIAQLVTLYKGKEQMRMSTRAGEFITLRQVLDEVGRDAARFFFCMRRFDTHLDFDLELAKKQTPDNPVFYVQYVHARISSIRQAQKEKGVSWMPDASLEGLAAPEEIRLLRLLRQYPRTVRAAASQLEPSIITDYLAVLAAGFHRFYEQCRVIGDDPKVTQARLTLVYALQIVIRSGLGLLGVSAPDKM